MKRLKKTFFQNCDFLCSEEAHRHEKLVDSMFAAEAFNCSSDHLQRCEQV